MKTVFWHMKRVWLFAMVMCIALGIVSAAAEEATDAPAVYAVTISEAQSNNDSDWKLGFHDYIEIHNESEQTIRLSHYFLSRYEDDPYACHMPAVDLGAGEYMLLVCDVDLLGLRLPKEGCEVYLHHRDGTLCDTVELPAMEDNVWQREHGLTTQPSPGYENTPEGAAAYRASFEQTLIINEVISSNSKYMPMASEYYDLIEIRNAGQESVKLSDYYLSDKKSNPFLWLMPDVELAPGEFYVVHASGEENELTAPFKVSATGETLYINDVDGKCIEALYVPPLMPDTSYGRYENELRNFEQPTIGEANN